MSFHRENVTWPSPDGRWNIGFYDFYETGGDDEDHDPEWDVEYDHSRFNWCSTGHATREEANDAWRGSNPGGGEVYETASEQTAKLDQMAADWAAQQAATPRSRGGRW